MSNLPENVFSSHCRKYYENGLSIIPVRGKRPFFPGWQKYCQNLPSEQEISEWEKRYSKCNIGLACGPASGIVGTDIDTEDPVVRAKINAVLPPSPVRKIGKKGETGFYRHNGHKNRKISLQNGGPPVIELLSSGNQTVLPGSIHPDTGKPYLWVTPDTLESLKPIELPVLPTNIMDQIHENLCGLKANIEDFGTSGRNSSLKSQVVAAIAKGKSDEIIAKEILIYDQSKHRLPLFTDQNDPQMRNQSREVNAYRFVKSIRKSIEQSGVPLIFDRKETSNKWSPRRDLPPLLPDVPTLPSEMVPILLEPWLTDVQKRMQIPLEMLAAPAIVAISSVVGRRCGIRPLQRDSWTVVPNLWGAVIAPPGFFKSPALKEAISPVLRLENEVIDKFKTEQVTRDAENFSLEMKIKAVKGHIEEHFKHNSKSKPKESLPIEELKKRLTEAQNELENAKAFCPRFTTNDATIEKLAELLVENSNGLLIFRDELYGFLIGLDKQGREQDRSFYLETWNGDGEYKGDRITRGSSHVVGLCLSILGGIQPERLNGYFSSVIAGNTGDDGFFSRFQMVVFPTLSKGWKVIDRYPDSESKDTVFQVLKKLSEFDFRNKLGNSNTLGELPATKFSPEAQDLFYQWLEKLENRVRSGQIDSPAWIAHLSKYRSLMPSLSLIFHLLDYLSGNTDRLEVSLSAARLAASWCDFLELHGEKIYAGMIQPSTQAAHALAKRISTGQVRDGMTIREIYRKHWSLLDTQRKVEDALILLEECAWVKIEDERTAGATKELIRLHPEFLQRSKP